MTQQEAPIAEAQHRIALRLRLSSGICSLPLERVHHLAGFATLLGQADDYFLGWLLFHGEYVPVFDLDRIVNEQPTPESFGSRIVVVEADPGAPTRLIGLLAAGLTDTVPANDSAAERLPLDSYLPMLYPLIPEPPAVPA